MLVYLSAPYSSVVDKDKHMGLLMKFAGEYMLSHPGEFIVTPLTNHYALDHVPGLGADWNFWKNYSLDLLCKCDRMLVIEMDGTDTSTGVKAEIKHAIELGIEINHVEL